MIPGNFNSWMEYHCDLLDADIFTGDVLYIPEQIKVLEACLERWARAIKEHKSEEAL